MSDKQNHRLQWSDPEAPDLFRAAIDGSPRAIVMRAAGVVVYANAAWKARAAAGPFQERSVPASADSSLYVIEFEGRPVEVEIGNETVARTGSRPEVREAERLESLGRWVAGVVHDFNNLLTAVMLYSDLLEQGLPAGGAQAGFNREIRHAATRGADLTRQLLALAEQRTPEPAIFSLNALIRDAKDVLQRLIGEHIELVLQQSSLPCNVKMNQSQMEQVLFNLALNSRDAMPSGGRLTIRTEEVQGDGGAGTALVVSDTGQGMDAGTMAHIFEPFFTTRPRGKGTGLGLSTVQSIVSQNGGTISVTSAPGQGTTMTVVLPSAEMQTAETITDMEEGLPAGEETILLVEDDSAVRSSIRSLLEACGYRVLEADSGSEAIRLATEFPGSIDLLMTDVVLPGCSGREVARRVRAARPHTCVLFISGYDLLAVDPEFEDYVVFAKPFNKYALAVKVRQSFDSYKPAINRAK